jgi:sugar O-acyltransferase (sialic acid O-acetyltransferase NeuD family)
VKTDSVVIYGTGRLSSLSWYCFTHDSDYRVEAFVVDNDYQGPEIHEGLPVIKFSQLPELYPPSQIDLHIPLGYQAINGLRRERFEQARALGYRFASYVSSRANVSSDARLGENCLVYENAIVEQGAVIGDNVVIRCGAHVATGCVLGSHSFIASQATLCIDAEVGEQAYVGVAAVIRDGVRVGERSFAGAGAGILYNTQPDSVYIGNPARRVNNTAAQVTS